LLKRHSVSLGIEAEAAGAVSEIKSRAAPHGFEAQVDGRTHVGNVGGSGAGDRHSRLGDAVVPEFELGRSAKSTLEATKQRVAAGEDVFVGGEVGGVSLVNLGDGQVEPAPAAGWRAGPEIQVSRGEADSQQTAGEIGEAGERTVDTGAAAHAGGFAVVGTGAGDDQFAVAGAGVGGDLGAKTRETFGGRGVKAHPGGLGAGSQALGGGQDVQGVEQVGLALPVAANDDAGAGRQIQGQTPVVAEVGELELGDAHWISRFIVTSAPGRFGLCARCRVRARPVATGCLGLRGRSSPREAP